MKSSHEATVKFCSAPEEVELEEYREKLAELLEQLADSELALASRLRELASFERRYLLSVGKIQAELDAIAAEIAELLHEANPEDEALRAAAAERRASARHSAEAVGSAEHTSGHVGTGKSDELRQLYKAAARRVHPDFAASDEDREFRERLMAQVNEAYANGDAARIQELLDEWQHSPEQVTGRDTASEIVRVIRQIHQVRRRLSRIAEELDRLEDSASAQLKAQVDAAAEEGRDLLAEVVFVLEREIATARIKLGSLRKAGSYGR